MGNSIKPHIEHAQKTGVCNLSKQNMSEVSISVGGRHSTLPAIYLSGLKVAVNLHIRALTK